MTWAYADKPDETAPLAEEYTIAGNNSDALVIPAGLAFAKAIKQQPGVILYQSDKRHPTEAGTFLAAATIYAAIYKKSPIGSPRSEGLSADTAKFLQSVAWETVQDYYKRTSAQGASR